MKGNSIVAQSGGPTAVINSSACGVIQEAMKHPEIEGVYAAHNGILGVLNEKIFDLRKEDPSAIEGLRTTPASALGSCRYKVRTENLDSFHSWRLQGPVPIVASSFRLRFKKGTEIPVRIAGDDANDLRPEYHLKFGEAGSKTQVKAWAIWELTNVPAATEGTEPVALIVGM